jgi:hypothetical protein
MAQKAGQLVVPQFKTEADEAQWWFDNRDKVEEALLNAMDDRTIRRGAPRSSVQARRSERIALPDLH